MQGNPVLRILLPLLLTLLASGTLYADNIKLLGDLSYIMAHIETKTLDTNSISKNQSDQFKQIYRLDLNKELFPNLNIDGGAQVENNRLTNEVDGVETDNRNMVIMPYIETTLQTPLYSLIAGYRERNAKSTGSALLNTERDYLKNYNFRGEWRPVELPRMELSYLHSERSDKPLTSANESDVIQFNSRYNYHNYEFLYNYLRTDDTDQINKTSTLTNTHNGRVKYHQTYLDGRVTLRAKVRAEYTEQTFSGNGTRDFAVFPSGTGFYYIDDDTLPNNNDPLTDYIPLDNNLDLNSDAILDIGLAFGEAVAVDMLQLTLSAELDPNSNIDNSANWTVYVSDDQDNWEARSVTAVEYLDAEKLLKIKFSPTTDNRYVMLVYSNIAPLSTNQIGAVPVTAIQAFVTRYLNDGSQLHTMAHNAQLGIGWQATEKTKYFYDLNFQERSSNLFDDQRIRLSNGFNVIHLFNEIFTGTGRFSVTDTWNQSRHDSSNYSYSAKVQGRYLETLNQSLIYSGTLNQDQRGDSTSNSVILHTNAELYRGWDIAFDQGLNWQSPTSGPDSSGFFIRLQNSLVPHRRFSLVTDYSIRWNKDSGEAYIRSESGRIRALWVPRDTLSLSGEVQLRSTNGDADIFWKYSANWLPLRDGSLQCNISYSEEEDLQGNRTRAFTPSLTWKITDYASLTLNYSQGTEESEDEVADIQSAQITFRIYYD